MELGKKTKLLVCFSVAAMAYMGGYTMNKAKTKIEYLEYEKEIFVDRDVIRYITRPDGTKEKIVDKSKESSNTQSSKESIEKPAEKDWIIGVSYSPTKIPQVYTLSVDRRILWNLYIGTYGRSDNEFGVSVKLLF